MYLIRVASTAAVLCLSITTALAGQAADKADKPGTEDKAKPVTLVAKQSDTEGSVTIDGKRVDYKAVAGTIVLTDKKDEPSASIFYAAYFKKAVEPSQRPLMFIYNGGPGSATIWLHMGAFGPRRVVTADDTHTAPAPYGLVNNDYSLLDVSDLVFIDAPGAGFSTFADKEKGPKEYFGVDA